MRLIDTAMKINFHKFPYFIIVKPISETSPRHLSYSSYKLNNWIPSCVFAINLAMWRHY